MFIVFEDRPSDSPAVERVWRSHSVRAGVFQSMAATHWQMVVTRHEGKTFFTIRGPETKATLADCPAFGEWLGVYFKLGAYMPHFPPGDLRDRKDITLPDATTRSFWLNGSAWEYPTFENIDTFVERLVKEGVIAIDPCVRAALRGQCQQQSLRTAQRRFLRATGITCATLRQIERARRATNLLRQGFSILDVVYEAGYFDQAHLTRSLKNYVGQTPAQILRQERQLSFLYNAGGV